MDLNLLSDQELKDMVAEEDAMNAYSAYQSAPSIPKTSPINNKDILQDSLWNRISTIFPDEASKEMQRATNSLVYSDMFDINPSSAYYLHDELDNQIKQKTSDIPKGYDYSWLEAGVYNSITGSILNQKAQMPTKGNMLEQLLSGATTILLDLPYYTLGGRIGTARGGMGITGNAAIAQTAGAFGFHGGLRKILDDAYSRGEVSSFEEFAYRVSNAIKGAIKGEITGSFLGAVNYMLPFWIPQVAGVKSLTRITQGEAIKLASEASTLTIVGAALEGHIPTVSEFGTNALLIAMLKGTGNIPEIIKSAPMEVVRPESSGEVSKELSRVFVETGVRPDTITNILLAEKPVVGETAVESIRRVEQLLKESLPIETNAGEVKTKETGIDATQKEITQSGAISELEKNQEYANISSVIDRQGKGNITAKDTPTPEADLEEVRKYKSADEFIKAQSITPNGHIDLYRGLANKFDKDFDLNKTDAPTGYSTWTDNIQLAREYAGKDGYIYRITLPKSELGNEIIDNNGDRPLFINNEKKAGINNVSGNEYLVYNYHENYSPDLISEVKTKAQLINIWNKAHERPNPSLPPEVGGQSVQQFTDTQNRAPEAKSSTQQDKAPIEEGNSDKPTSILSRNVRASMEARGLEPLKTDAKAEERQAATREAVLNGDINPVTEISKMLNIVEKERTLAPTVEQVEIMKIHKALVYREIDKLRRISERTPEQERQLEQWQRERDKNEKVTEATGAEQSAAFSGRKDDLGSAIESNSPTMMEDYLRKQGVDITPKISEKLGKASARVEDALEKNSVGEFNSVIERTVKAEKLAKRKEKRKQTIEEIDAEIDSLFSELVKDSQTTLGMFNIDPAKSLLMMKITRGYIRKGVVKAEDIVDNIYTKFIDSGIEITKREIRDAISGYGREKKNNVDELVLQEREIKRQLRLQSQIEDAKAGVERGTGARVVDSERVKELKAELEQARKEAGFNVDPKEKAFIDEYLKDVENPANPDYELFKAKQAYIKEVDDAMLSKRTDLEKTKDFFFNLLASVKALKASFDVSATARQGIMFLLSHPVIGSKQAAKAFGALRSEERAFAIEKEILADPLTKEMVEKGKYRMSTLEDKKTTDEQWRDAKWAEKVWGVKQSERNFNATLNLMRLEMYRIFRNEFKDRAPTDKEIKEMVADVEMFTGRGKWEGQEQAISTAGKLLWAPSLYLARFQTVMGKGLITKSPEVRTAVIKTYARALASITAVYAAANAMGMEVGDEPTSSSFGKVRVGNTWVDPLGGLLQYVVLTSRLSTGTYTSMKGRRADLTNPKFGQKDKWTILMDFMRSKLTPVVGIAVDFGSGKNIVGQKRDLSTLPMEMFAPLSMRDLLDAMGEEGVPAGLALGTLGMFGVGIQTMEDQGGKR